MQLRLHTRYQNSAGQRVRIVLNLKGIRYEYVPIPSVSSPAYRAINPQGLMPALEIDGRVVAQSMAIVELLEELFPQSPMLPGDPLARAQARAFAYLITADLHPINNNRVRKYLAGTMGASKAKIHEWYRHWIAVTFEALEAELTRRNRETAYSFGDTPGLAEACLVPQNGQCPPLRLRPQSLPTARGNRRTLSGPTRVRRRSAGGAARLSRVSDRDQARPASTEHLNSSERSASGPRCFSPRAFPSPAPGAPLWCAARYQARARPPCWIARW